MLGISILLCGCHDWSTYRVVNNRETNNVTYNTKNRHSESADKCPSFQTYQVMLEESGHKVILEAVFN